MKRIIKYLLIFLAIIAIAVASLWRKEIKTISSVNQIDTDGYLYEMYYSADYNLDDVIEADIDQNAKLLNYVIEKISKGLYKPNIKKAGNEFSCTSFQAKNADSDGYLFGRNYDFYKNPILVVHSNPKNGYASLSVCDMSHFGYSVDKVPTSFSSKALCIASVYAPMDGINEKGLCISIMALPKQPSQQDTEKHDVGTTIIMRLVLDRCATVDEAIALFNSFDIRHDATAGSGYHYMVADKNGDCAVIEFDLEDGWKTMVTRKDSHKNYMQVTNHLLSPKYYTTEPNEKYGNPHSRSWWRYQTVQDFMDNYNGVISLSQAQEILSNVHWKDLKWDNGLIENTQYSNVYDQNAMTLSLRPWNDYDTTYSFFLTR